MKRLARADHAEQAAGTKLGEGSSTDIDEFEPVLPLGVALHNAPVKGPKRRSRGLVEIAFDNDQQVNVAYPRHEFARDCRAIEIRGDEIRAES